MKRQWRNWVVAAALLPGAAAAQEKLVQQEVAFARGLARDYGFVGLANEVLDDLLKRKDLSEDALNAIRLERCNLLMIAARVTGEAEKKRQLFGRALEEINQLIDRFRGQDTANEARILLVEGATAYGQLLRLILDGEADPERKTLLLKEADGIYRQAIKAANDVKGSLEKTKDADEAAKILYFRGWLGLGELQMGWAAIGDPTERKVRLGQVKTILRNLIFEVELGTVIGIRAQLLLAQAEEMDGNLEEARDTFTDVKEVVWKENLKSEDREVPPHLIPLLANLMEDAYARLIKLNNDLGETEEAVKMGKELADRLAELKVQPSNPQGFLALVEYARALADSGDVEKALKMLAEVGDKAPNSLPGLQAKQEISKLTKEVDPTKLGPSILFQAADGAYRDQKLEACLQDAKRVLRAIKTVEQAREHGLRTYDLIGRALLDLGRPIDAAYAMGVGCDLYGGLDQGDEKYKDKVSFLALRVKASAERALQLSGNSPGLAPLRDYATATLKKWSKGGVDQLLANEGMSLFSENKFDEARSQFGQIPEKSDWYERALVMRARCLYAKGDSAGARRELKAYLDDYLPKKGAGMVPGSRAAQNREIATALAVYLLGEMAYNEAAGDKTTPGKPALYDDVVRLFTDFSEKYKDQDELVAGAFYYLGRAWAAKGDLPAARGRFRELKRVKARSQQVPTLALALFIAHDERVKAARVDTKPAAVESALRDALGFFDEYLENNDSPQFEAMYRAFTYAVELKEIEKAFALYQEIEKFHGKTQRDQIKANVLPWMVELLQRVGDFNRARPLVESLLAAYAKGRVPVNVIWLGIWQYGGWLEVKNGQVVEVVGQDEPLKALEPGQDGLMPTLYRTVWSPSAKFKLEWYQVVAQFTYLAYRAGLKNSKWSEEARSFLRIAASIDKFEGVKQAAPLNPEELAKLSADERARREAEMARLRQDLFMMFQYLERKVGK